MLMTRVQDPDLIARIYEAAADPAQWNGAWSALCRAFNAETGLLFHQASAGAKPRMLAMTNWETIGPQLHTDYFMQCDPFAQAAAGSSGYRSFLGQEVMAPAAPGRSEIHNDFAWPYRGGVFHVLCAALPLQGTSRAGLGLHRPIEAAALDESDRDALDHVARHVGAALRLERLLSEERMASAARGAALDQVSHGAVIVDDDGEVLFANAAAERMAEPGGLMLPAPGGGISCAKPAEAERLGRLIYGAAHGGAGGCTRITRPGRMPILAATVAPLPVSLAASAGLATAHRPMALVTLRDLGATSEAAQVHLMELFGLTAVEAGILPQLLAGDSAVLIAQSRGVAVATIRAHAACVLHKTGATNLRALAGMITALGCG